MLANKFEKQIDDRLRRKCVSQTLSSRPVGWSEMVCSTKKASKPAISNLILSSIIKFSDPTNILAQLRQLLQYVVIFRI